MQEVDGDTPIAGARERFIDYIEHEPKLAAWFTDHIRVIEEAIAENDRDGIYRLLKVLSFRRSFMVGAFAGRQPSQNAFFEIVPEGGYQQ
jgi:hypothetical protein